MLGADLEHQVGSWALGAEAEGEAGQARDSVIRSLFDYLKLAGIVMTVVVQQGGE
jgi:hypothetical protein